MQRGSGPCKEPGNRTVLRKRRWEVLRAEKWRKGKCGKRKHRRVHTLQSVARPSSRGLVISVELLGLWAPQTRWSQRKCSTRTEVERSRRGPTRRRSRSAFIVSLRCPSPHPSFHSRTSVHLCVLCGQPSPRIERTARPRFFLNPPAPLHLPTYTVDFRRPVLSHSSEQHLEMP